METRSTAGDRRNLSRRRLRSSGRNEVDVSKGGRCGSEEEIRSSRWSTQTGRRNGQERFSSLDRARHRLRRRAKTRRRRTRLLESNRGSPDLTACVHRSWPSAFVAEKIRTGK